MKKLLFVIVALVAAFIIYGLVTEQNAGVSPRPTPQPTATPAPTATVAAATPAPTRATPLPSAVAQTAPPRPRATPNRAPPGAMSYSDKRSAEIRRIIYRAAQRAGWRIRSNGYQQVRYGISRVVGAGDNTQAQRFMSEVQASHILRGEGIELGPARPVTVEGRHLIESTFIIHWQ
jgi:hypothetical protein